MQKLDPKQMESILSLLSNFYQSRKDRELLAAAEMVIAIHSDDFMLWNIYCFALARMGRTHDAIECICKSSDLLNQNTKVKQGELRNDWMVLCNKMISADKENAFLWYCKGMLMNQSQEYFETTIQSFDHAIKLDPNLSLLSVMKAHVLSESGKNSQAIIACTDALAINQCDPSAWNIKGTILFAKTQKDEAIMAFNEAISIDRNFTAPWLNKCLALRSLGRDDDLARTIQEAKKIAPTDKSFQKRLLELEAGLPKSCSTTTDFPDADSIIFAEKPEKSESLKVFNNEESAADSEKMKLSALNLLRTALQSSSADFRDDQWEIIAQLVNKKAHMLVVQRTGWGKSIVYFIATKLLRENGYGPTLLISPLLALMRNQIQAAERIGLCARTLNSSNKDEWDQIHSTT